MFKYLWFIPLFLAYWASWVYSVNELVEAIKKFKPKDWIYGLSDFSIGWFLTHILGLFVLSAIEYFTWLKDCT